MIQNRVLAVYFSMMRLKAICATAVMASASSSIMSLKLPNEGVSPAFGIEEKICFVPSIVDQRQSETFRYPSPGTYWRMS